MGDEPPNGRIEPFFARSERRFRTHERRSAPLPRASVTFVHERTQASGQAVLVDISLGGAGLASEDALFPGDRLSLSLPLPNRWDPLVLPCVVIWSRAVTAQDPDDLRGSRSGVAFDYLGSAEILDVVGMLVTLSAE